MISKLQSQLVTVFEDSTTLLPDYKNYVQELYVLRDIVGENNFLLQADGTFRIMHYVGFFQKGKVRIQILPKIYRKPYRSDVGQERNQSLDFIHRLLYWSGFLKHKSLKPQSISSSETDLLEIFISLFIDDFIVLFRRKIFRKYEERVESQQFIKGKILFSETIRSSPILRHLHMVRFDEYSINNPLNKIFKSLLLQLIRQTNSRNNKQKIAQGLVYLEDVEYVPLTVDLFKSIKFNRLNSDFEPLFNLAKLFFHNHQPGLTDGQEKTISFLVPINALFESLLGKILSTFSGNSFKFNYHSPERWLAEDKQTGSNVFLLRPDFTVTQNEIVITILDAKYKSPFNDTEVVKISEKDVYQMSAYALRYNCRNLFLIYPAFLGSELKTSLLAHYKIDSGFGEISLRIIQIDMLEKEIGKLIDSFRSNFYSFFTESSIGDNAEF